MTTQTELEKIYTSEYFESRCGGYEFFDTYRQKVLKPLIQAAKKIADLQPGDKVLDVGFGRGELVANLADEGVSVVGIDFAKEAVKLAEKTFPQGKFVLASADEIPFPPQSFDKIFYLGIIEHLTDKEIKKSFQQMAELLKPGGKIIITTCTNQLYLKLLTYNLRLGIINFLNKVGLKFKKPSVPKSDEDELMHVNEVHYFSLKRALSQLKWRVKILPRPNPKLATKELYGDHLPKNLPIRHAPIWKQGVYKFLFFWFPLNLLLARSYLATIEKPR